MFDVSSFDLDFRPIHYPLAVSDPEEDEESIRLLAGATPFGPGRSFLEPAQAGEADIAEVVLQSTMGDIIVVRARRDGDGYRYRITDEYEDDWGPRDECPYTPPFETSTQPLSFRELIRFLDGVKVEFGEGDVHGLVQVYRSIHVQNNTREARQEGRDFADISSNLYPELERWYDLVGDHYVETGEHLYLHNLEGQ